MASPRLGALVVIALLTLGLSACNGTPDPVKTPPPEIDISGPSDGGGESDGGGAEQTAAAAGEIPAPDPADYPGMDEETPEGAEQAYRYYWAVLVWAHQSGDSELVAALSSDDCENCSEFKNEIDALAESDDLWGETKVTDVGVTDLDGKGEYDLLIQYEFVLSDTMDEESDGESTSGKKYRTTGGVVWSGQEWLVHELSVEIVDGDES